MKRLNERQEAILLSLKKLDYLNRDQLRRLHRLGEIRNTNRVLAGLADYLTKYRDEYSTVYYLNAQGRAYVDCEKVRKRGNKVDHALARNSFYITVGQPADWKNEVRVGDSEGYVICDSWFALQGRKQFLEVDLTQHMRANRAKIDAYRALFERGALTRNFGYFPRLNWLTTSELRRKQLTSLCGDLPHAVLTLNDIK